MNAYVALPRSINTGGRRGPGGRRERFVAAGREPYPDFPIRMVGSLLDRDWTTTKRNPVGATRNWNTVLKLTGMLEA